MTYAEAIQFLHDLSLFGANFGLETTRKLAALAGNPQDKLRFIHVAGTNGKGSTCAMLESIYRAAGLRVGLFTSPHLVSFRERMQVNRQLVGEADVVRLVELMQSLLQQFPTDHHPTFFEVVTVMALLYFAEQKCDLVIWETGLGGRLDATNIVTPLASVITNVQYDHQQCLGDTLEQIAAEKAGIIKPDVPVVTAAAASEALTVIEQTAKRLNAPLVNAEQPSQVEGADELPTLRLLGEHQRLNAALAIAVVNALQQQIPVSDAQIRAGLSRLDWPGRLQLVKTPAGQTFLLDGAHNVAGAEALRSALEKHFKGQRPSLILGILEDKDWRHICETLAPLAVRILTVPVSSSRAADTYSLAEACRAVNSSAVVVACGSLREALEHAAKDAFVVVTGSLYLVGEALEMLGVCPVACGERELNEWNAPAIASEKP
jgi:dihydrofolate synthase / folylpolyglutamate synthase